MGENSNKPVRVNDPWLRAFGAILSMLGIWGMSQIYEQGKAISAITARQAYIESRQSESDRRTDVTVGGIRADLQQIRNAIERRP